MDDFNSNPYEFLTLKEKDPVFKPAKQAIIPVASKETSEYCNIKEEFCSVCICNGKCKEQASGEYCDEYALEKANEGINGRFARWLNKRRNRKRLAVLKANSRSNSDEIDKIVEYFLDHLDYPKVLEIVHKYLTLIMLKKKFHWALNLEATHDELTEFFSNQEKQILELIRQSSEFSEGL